MDSAGKSTECIHYSDCPLSEVPLYNPLYNNCVEQGITMV